MWKVIASWTNGQMHKNRRKGKKYRKKKGTMKGRQGKEKCVKR